MTTKPPSHLPNKSATTFGGREARSAKASETRISHKPLTYEKHVISTQTGRISNNEMKSKGVSRSRGGINPPYATDIKEAPASKVQRSSSKETTPTSGFQRTFNNGSISSVRKPLYPEKHTDKTDDLGYPSSAQGSKHSISPQNGYDNTSATKTRYMSQEAVKSPTSSTSIFAGNQTKPPTILGGREARSTKASETRISHKPLTYEHVTSTQTGRISRNLRIRIDTLAGNRIIRWGIAY